MIKYLENKEDFIKEIAKDKILVDFYADWCGPCKMMGEILKEIESIDILKVNTDEFPELAQKYGIMSIPTLIVFEKGKECQKTIGMMSKQELLDWLKVEK